MKKRTVILLIVLTAIVLALLVGWPLFNRLYYGRSQAATLFAWQFHKDAYTTEEAFEAYIEEKRAENALFYPAPTESLTLPLESGSAGDVPYYILNPADSPQKLLVYFAGGSFIDQPRPVHWQFLESVAQDTGATVVLPIYPKLPQVSAAEAYAALMHFCDALLADLPYGELIFMGDSAGGGMALSLAMQLRDAGSITPEKLILLSPWVDVTMENPDIPAYEKKDTALDSAMLARLGTLWADELPATDPTVSPLYGRFEGLGKITLAVGTGELLYPDIMRLDAALTESGIDHDLIIGEGMFHVWPLYKDYNIPEAQETYSELISLISGS